MHIQTMISLLLGGVNTGAWMINKVFCEGYINNYKGILSLIIPTLILNRSAGLFHIDEGQQGDVQKDQQQMVRHLRRRYFRLRDLGSMLRGQLRVRDMSDRKISKSRLPRGSLAQDKGRSARGKIPEILHIDSPARLKGSSDL